LICLRIWYFLKLSLTNLFLFLGHSNDYFLAEYFETRRGNKGLKVEGHIFVKEKENKRTINWSCLLNKKYKCRARATTDLKNPDYVRLTHRTHSHSIESYGKGKNTFNSGIKIKFPNIGNVNPLPNLRFPPSIDITKVNTTCSPDSDTEQDFLENPLIPQIELKESDVEIKQEPFDN
jgi:hypothetical protein